MTKGLSMASLSLYILTFNCAHNLIDVPAFASQFFNGLEDSVLPDVVVISLQEISTISQGFIGGSFLAPFFARIQDALQIAARNISRTATDQYTPIAIRNIGMTAVMVFAKDATAIEGIETAGIGLGASEMGNKAAVGVRMVYRDVNSPGDTSTELTFVAAHLAAMEDEIERRNENWKNIVRGLVFSSTAQERQSKGNPLSADVNQDELRLLSVFPRYAGIYKPTSHLFLAGDLNYRTSTVKPSPLDHRNSFPQPQHGETDLQHHTNLLEHDQLTQERLAGRTCHGLVEAPITFPPTYKYNQFESNDILVPDDQTSRWTWASHRWPSWTDRILYLPMPAWVSRYYPDAEVRSHKYTALPLFLTSDHRPVALLFDVPLIPIPKPEEEDEEDGENDDPRLKPPFDINPDWKADREKARRLELISGYSMYLTGTWEGWGIIGGTAAGILGGYFMLRAMLDF